MILAIEHVQYWVALSRLALRDVDKDGPVFTQNGRMKEFRGSYDDPVVFLRMAGRAHQKEQHEEDDPLHTRKHEPKPFRLNFHLHEITPFNVFRRSQHRSRSLDAETSQNV